MPKSKAEPAPTTPHKVNLTVTVDVPDDYFERLFKRAKSEEEFLALLRRGGQAYYRIKSHPSWMPVIGRKRPPQDEFYLGALEHVLATAEQDGRLKWRPPFLSLPQYRNKTTWEPLNQYRLSRLMMTFKTTDQDQTVTLSGPSVWPAHLAGTAQTKYILRADRSHG